MHPTLRATYPAFAEQNNWYYLELLLHLFDIQNYYNYAAFGKFLTVKLHIRRVVTAIAIHKAPTREKGELPPVWGSIKIVRRRVVYFIKKLT